LNLDQCGAADLFYTDLVITSHAWNDDFLHFIEKCRIQFNLPVICDVDDLINDMPIDHSDYVAFGGTKLTQIATVSSFMVYSSEYLKMKLGHLNKNNSVIQNSVNKRMIKRIDPKYKPYKNCFMVGWTGSQSHRSDQYYTFLDGLREFLRKRDDAKAYFHILCPDILSKEFGSQIIFEPNPVDYLDYPAVAAAYPFDVCLVGLTDTPFNHAKSDLKLLEMAPFGIGVIASPRHSFMQHKESGFVLYAEDNSTEYPSWLQQLEYAYEHQDRIKEMADSAWDYIKAHRTSELACKQWEAVIDQTMQLSIG
jgi:hypothetical protein